MNLFRYVENPSLFRAGKIYLTVLNSKGLAISTYGESKGLQAIDATLDHVMKNFVGNVLELDEFGNEKLAKYVNSIIVTIMKKDAKSDECPVDFSDDDEDGYISNKTAIHSLNSVACDLDYITNPAEIYLGTLDDTFEKCKKDFLDYFIVDYKTIIYSGKAGRNKEIDYKKVLNKFTDKYGMKCLTSVIEYYTEKYSERLQKLDELAKSCKGYSYSEERLEFDSSGDKYIVKSGEVHDTLIYNLNKSNVRRYFYSLNLSDMISNILNCFYGEKQDTCNCWYREPKKQLQTYADIEERRIYCTTSGTIVEGIEKLKDKLEIDLLGHLLSRNNMFKLVSYEKGKLVVFSTSSILDSCEQALWLFNNKFNITFELVAGRCEN